MKIATLWRQFLPGRTGEVLLPRLFDCGSTATAGTDACGGGSPLAHGQPGGTSRYECQMSGDIGQVVIGLLDDGEYSAIAITSVNSRGRESRILAENLEIAARIRALGMQM